MPPVAAGLLCFQKEVIGILQNRPELEPRYLLSAFRLPEATESAPSTLLPEYYQLPRQRELLVNLDSTRTFRQENQRKLLNQLLLQL